MVTIAGQIYPICIDSIIIVGDQLDTLPPEIRYLTKLNLLILDGNQFTILPPEIQYYI
jgi:hypothetical protein